MNDVMAPASMPDGAIGEIMHEVAGLVPRRLLADPALVAAAARAWAPNTKRAFLSDIRLWAAWCQRRGVAAGNAGAAHVAGYVRLLAGIDRDATATVKVRAAATIERYLVNIGWAYRMAGLDDPTRAPLVRLELKGARKSVGTRQRQARAIRFKGEVADLGDPATGVCLAALLKACRRDLLGLRDAALLRIAYDTGCRRSELVAIRCEDVEGPEADGAGILFIGASKTDRERRGAVSYLAPDTMAALDAWREAARIERGPLLRRVETHFDGSVRTIGQGALHPNSINLIYQRLLRSAFDRGLLADVSAAEFERWRQSVSSHSIRVGVAQDSIAAGESLPAIMQAYRWRDAKTVMRYGAKLAARSGASARLARRFSA